MKKYLLLLLFLSISTLNAKEFGLHFDDSGNIIRPDQEFLARGLDDEKDGFRNSARKNFKRSAEYGNHLAMSLVGLYEMQDKNYVEALAWYQLVSTDKLPNGAMIDDIVKNLETILKPEEIKEAKELKAKLAETYGNYATLMKREAWKNSLQFTGTHLKGYIPPFLTIELNSGITVTGNVIKKQVENFIYNYEFDNNAGDVILEDVVIIEDDTTDK